jgi:hypothetical protein
VTFCGINKFLLVNEKLVARSESNIFGIGFAESRIEHGSGLGKPLSNRSELLILINIYLKTSALREIIYICP